jgi:predicted deacylase
VTKAEPRRDGVRVEVVHDTDGVVGATRYVALDAEGRPVPGPRVGLIANMHGNEPVGALVFERLAPLVPDQLVAGELLLVRANVAAAAINRRHTPEGTDLNRLWAADTLEALAAMPPEERCYEHQRALDLAPLLQTCDALLDLHSASQPAPPFLVVRDDQRHASLVQRLGVARVITGLHEEGILGGAVGPDVGLLLGERSQRVGITFEAGQHADPENRRRALEVALRLLDALGVWRMPAPPAEVRPRIFEVIDRFRQAPPGAEPFYFPGYTPGQPSTLASGRPLASFERVEAGEELLRREPFTVVRAPSPFTLILPTPTADPGTDMYYVAIERRIELSDEARPRTSAEATLEAAAIERVLDVLDDDELGRGATWVSFDRRQVLDQTADLVGRVLRLPAGHPHRRIAIVGRGDWGGGGSEQRAGRRYRQAISRAIADGVPIDRYQLLRGAARGWLDALTGPGMGRLLDARRRVRVAHGLQGTGIRLFLSATQPSSVALLVTGDLDAAGDLDARHVRVGLVVEAPVVEPDRDGVAIRVLRFGLFSSRIEFLRTARALLGTLREHHAGLVRHPPLSDEPAVQDLIGEGDAIVPPGDPGHLRELGDALGGLQLRLWRDALRREVRPERIEEPPDLGRWLARTMARSGVLDPAALRGLLVGEDGHVDPRRLDLPVPPRIGPAPERRTRIRPPLVAHDVDPDTLPRWVSWKRFLRQRQLVPETRGQDLDLLFDEQALSERLIRWFDQARDQASRAPGRVQILMAGNGLRPQPGDRVGTPLVAAHTALLLDPNVRYLRIQHASGSYLRWLKGLVHTLRHRPAGPAPAGIRFEGEHGASINLILMAVRDDPAPAAWSLEGWRVERCAVLISSLGGPTGGGRVGVFTEPLPGRAIGNNPELLQYGRAHVEALLLQGGTPMIDGDAERAEHVFLAQLARWIERARDLHDAPVPVPEGEAARAAWLQARLGLADPDLVRELVREVGSDAPAPAIARAIWDMVVPWPEI